jgi:hypothetical protein
MPKQITMIFWRDNDIGQAHLDNVSGHGAPQVARRPPIFAFDLARSLKMGVRRALTGG